MPDVVVRAPFHLARAQRQKRLSAIKRLHLALLIQAQHDGTVGWGQV
jgi:hypothetical protein